MPSPEPLLPASSRYVPADEKSAGFRLSYALASYTHTGQTLELHLERLKGAAPLNNFSWQVGSPVTEKWPGGKVAEVKVSKFDSKPDGTDRAIISVQVQVTLSAKPQSVSYFVPVIGNGAKITVQVNSLN